MDISRENINAMIEEIRDYQTNKELQAFDGWKDTFYDGVEYAIDVIVEYLGGD